MKRQLLEILACPVCKYHPLQLETAVEDDKGVVTGTLVCPHCRIGYPITDGIPNMIPPNKE